MKEYTKFEVPIIKWSLMLVFILGYLLTFKEFDHKSVEYFIYNLLALFSCAVLLVQIKLFEQKVTAVLIALAILILVYFIRFYWITVYPESVRVMLPSNPFITMVADREALLEAFKLSVVAFASFNLSASAMLFIMRKQTVHVDVDRDNSTLYGMIATRSLWAVTVLMFVLSYMMYKYHIGQMGAQAGEALPFRLKGVFFYAKTIVVPLVILFSIYLAERSSHMLASRWGILILIMHGVTDMLLRGSRSGLILSLLLLAFLTLAGGIKFRRKEKIFLGLMIPLALFMIPLMTEYRYYRIQENLPQIEAFANALSITGQNWWLQIFKGFQFAIFRMPGIESLWSMLAWHAEPLGINSIDVIKSKDGIAAYLTLIIYPLLESDNTLLAPGFVGWFYLVAGLPAIIFGSIVAGIASVLGWKLLDRRYLKTGPVAQVFFLWMLFLAFTEGTLDSMVRFVFVGAMTLAFLELSLRILEHKVLTKKSKCELINPR